MEHITNIEAALEAVQEAHNEYSPLFEAYRASMNNAGGYESTGQDDTRAGTALKMIEDGELTSKGIARAVETGLIRKIVAQKPAALIAAEEALTGAHREYLRITAEAVSKYQFVKSRARATPGNEHTLGEIGEAKKQDVSAIIRGIDDGATINFSGRRVFGTLSTGATFDYDAYGQSYPASIAKMMNRA